MIKAISETERSHAVYHLNPLEKAHLCSSLDCLVVGSIHIHKVSVYSR